MTIRGAQSAHRRRGCAIRIFDKLGCRPRVSETSIHRHIRFDIQQPTKRHEFIGAHVVRLNGVPDGIHSGWTLVRIAYAIAPLVCRYKVAAREAIYAGMQLLERRYNFRAKTLHVVGWHQRDCSNMKGAATGAHDL